MALTKTRFVAAAECATKLFYKDNRQYIDTSVDDGFLQALAEGGFQVGALARVVWGGGTLVQDGDLEQRVRHTSELLKRDEVVIYEAAVQSGDLLVLVDVLTKRGDRVELREVKAKSYDGGVDGDFRKRRGTGFKSEWLPYLLDIAFQHYVVSRALPNLTVHSYLVLADKSKRATVDGLNRCFRIRRIDDRRSEVVVLDGTERSTIGEVLLVERDVQAEVAEIHAGTLQVGGRELPFGQAVAGLAKAHVSNTRIWAPPGSKCGKCEFRAEPQEGRRVGFRECWSQAFGWKDRDFEQPIVLDLWNHKSKDRFIKSGLLKLAALREEDIGDGPTEYADGGMTNQARQKLQVRHARGEAPDVHFDAAGYAAARRKWIYPLNFIDFETSAVAIPFTRGRRPYEQTAFQFSHHLMHEDGRVEHKTQFIDVTAGKFPNYDFVRALRDALSRNTGTVFRWHEHEQKILRAIHEQLKADEPMQPDAVELCEFIESITYRVDGSGERIPVPRTMVDLCEIAERFYFDASTRGSSSLKKVLPALMRSSPHLRARYSQPVYGKNAAIPSLNFDEPTAWWQMQDGVVTDPYSLLPPIFTDLSPEALQQLEWSQSENLADGAAAMTAYARLQFEGIPDEARSAVERSLLRYCELDTLAMVMAVQAWDARLAEMDALNGGDAKRRASA